MATAYLIHGFLGVGKTTLAKRMAAQYAAVRISPDEWYIALYGMDGQVGIDPRSEQRMIALIAEVWPAVLTAGADVVLDMGFWTRADRDRTRAMAQAVGADVALVEVTTSEPVAIERCVTRNGQSIGSFFIDDETYHRLKSQFEPLEPDEQRTTVVT